MSSYLLPSVYLFPKGPIIKHTDPAWFRRTEVDSDALEREEASYAASLAAIRNVAAPKPIGLGTTNSTLGSTNSATAAAVVAAAAAAGRGEDFLVDTPTSSSSPQAHSTIRYRTADHHHHHPSYSTEREDHPTNSLLSTTDMSTPGSPSGNSAGSRAAGDNSTPTSRRRIVRIAPRITYTTRESHHTTTATTTGAHSSPTNIPGGSNEMAIDRQRTYGEALEMIYGDEVEGGGGGSDEDDDMEFDDSYEQVYGI
jgi:hypothetical protein